MSAAEQVIAEVDRILTQQFEIEAELVRPDAKLKEDLDLDSLDGADLMIALEKRFGVRLDESVARSFTTVGDIHAYVRKLVEETKAAG